MPRKRPDIARHLCQGGCGRGLVGNAKLCGHCAPKCACGRRARTGRGTCQPCADAGEPDVDVIVWRRRADGVLVQAGRRVAG